MTHKKILTKANLRNKEWTRSMKCQFCSSNENTIHLFLKCPFAQHIELWLGHRQNQFKQWSNVQDIVDFACKLDKNNQIAFLMVSSAACWTIWKIRNEMCFQQKKKLQNI